MKYDLKLSPLQHHNTAVQGHKAVFAYFTSKKMLPFGFAGQNSPAKQTVLAAHFLK